ncbi:hypothetical protein NQ318_020058 [Aromia moschata]|uniref:ATP synthase F0 subunit 8 n=1 Tax=Aromia moschata TaxID=1265417 RepID=A0AAV8Z983_9CUCU|nr:hypothetical protein NQ318_020058 [Aromia moschata]
MADENLRVIFLQDSYDNRLYIYFFIAFNFILMFNFLIKSKNRNLRLLFIEKIISSEVGSAKYQKWDF